MTYIITHKRSGSYVSAFMSIQCQFTK